MQREDNEYSCVEFREEKNIPYSNYLQQNFSISSQKEEEEPQNDTETLDLTEEDIKEINSKIDLCIEESDAKNFVNFLLPLTQFLSTNENIKRNLVRLIFCDSHLYNYLVHGPLYMNLIESKGEDPRSILIPSDFLTNLTYHSEGFCDLLVDNKDHITIFIDLIMKYPDNLVIMNAITPILFNVFSYNRPSRFISNTFMFTLLEYTEKNSDNRLGFFFSFLMINIARKESIEKIENPSLFISKLSKLILQRHLCSLNLMWVLYFIFKVSGELYILEDRCNNDFFKQIINDDLSLLLQEMLNFIGDITPSLIALYILSWLALDVGNKGISALYDINIDIIKNIIESGDFNAVPYAFSFLSNYVATCDSIIDELFEKGFYDAALDILEKGHENNKMHAVFFFCSSLYNSTKRIAVLLGTERVLEVLIETLENTNDQLFRDDICSTLKIVIIRNPSIKKYLIDSDLNDILDDINEELTSSEDQISENLKKSIIQLQYYLETEDSD